MKTLSILFVCLATSAYAEIPAYHRDAFGTWIDADHDCQNTRAEILQLLSTSTSVPNPSGCSIQHGEWYDPYTDKTFTEASDLDIDHVVPLSYAWEHGAYKWTDKQRRAFANDLKNLFPVDAKANRSKGDSGPLEWLPPNQKFQCYYVVRFRRVFITYDLEWSFDERNKLMDLQYKLCKD